MKRYITIIVAATALHTAATAQNRLGATIDVQEFGYHADSVKVELQFNLEDLNIGTNESVVFTPKITKGESGLELPTVVVQRRGGARLYNRAITLDNTNSIETYNDWYGSPYQVVEYFGSQKQESVHYSLTLPYQSWMVKSQITVDCTTCGCCSAEDSGSLAPDDNTLYIDIMSVESYQLKPLVELIKPEKVAIKRRDIEYSSALIFKVNSTYIDPNLESNRAELASIDEMMQSVISDSDYTITGVNIIGYASPEGLLETNMKLSKGRAAALETLMKRDYKSIAPELYRVDFGGENWDKLSEIVGASDLEERDQILEIIDNTSIEDGRESKLMALNGGTTYRYLLKNIFPATRLVVVEVDYNVDAYDLVRIEELIDVKPQNLSLEEMYRLSESYTVDNKRFEKIFLTAVSIYPDDEVAQNNALATEIRRGNISTVDQVASQVDPETNSAELANSLGAYYMLSGDYNAARTMLQRAINLGSTRAKTNMEQLETKLKNIRQIEETEAFRAKIYGAQ
ncbi:MAG: DUF3868 domain-containing protein [Rikenellaceae bacterium]